MSFSALTFYLMNLPVDKSWHMCTSFESSAQLNVSSMTRGSKLYFLLTYTTLVGGGETTI